VIGDKIIDRVYHQEDLYDALENSIMDNIWAAINKTQKEKYYKITITEVGEEDASL
jgi:hypothetical protein